MVDNIDALQSWTLAFLITAAVCTTAFPILWAFSRWWITMVGRLLMFQAIAFALAIDATLVFQFVDPEADDVLKLFWLNAIIFGLIALSTLLLTITMIRYNYFRGKKRQAHGD